MNDLCICILAHNEQKHIVATIEALAVESARLGCDIKVYANGCTDATIDIVRELMQTIPRLFLRELAVASKPNAWNTAFHENHNPVLVFSDGDVIPEEGAIESLWRLLIKEHSEILLAGCSFWPKNNGLTLEQRVVGLLQIPLVQNFLSGQLYAIKRQGLALEMQKKDIYGIPVGVVAEDTFLELLLPPEKSCIIAHKVYYEPPNYSDYWKYLARMRWQDEQLKTFYGGLLTIRQRFPKNILSRLREKADYCHNIKFLLIRGVASGLRCLVKVLFRKKITQHYQAMGPVTKEGGGVLSVASRSDSTK